MARRSHGDARRRNPLAQERLLAPHEPDRDAHPAASHPPADPVLTPNPEAARCTLPTARLRASCPQGVKRSACATRSSPHRHLDTEIRRACSVERRPSRRTKFPTARLAVVPNTGSLDAGVTHSHIPRRKLGGSPWTPSTMDDAQKENPRKSEGGRVSLRPKRTSLPLPPAMILWRS
jgi:hypothetical protein